MPVTRRSTGGARARAGPAKGQSTLSFASRVTKPGARTDAAKAAKENVAKAVIRASSDSPSPASSHEEPSKVEIVEVPGEDEVGVEKEPEEPEEGEADTDAAPVAVEKTEAELEAEEISDAQIRSYLGKIDKARLAPMVHQEELSAAERILRCFDVSSQYGPCIGTPRIRRWQRAQRLRLNPPIEVLAVLMQEEAKGNEGMMAHMDELMNSTAVGSA